MEQLIHPMISDTVEEKDFRVRYAKELRKKKVNGNSTNPHFMLDELSEERAMVKQQPLITPGRRGLYSAR